MIQGNKKLESEYRNLQIDSSSSLKEFALNRKKYYKRYFLNEKVEDEEDNKSATMGVLVEILLLEPDRFEEKFHMSSLAKAPTGKMLDFCNALVNITLQSTDESGNITKTFEEMATEARTLAQFDWSLKVILDKFVGKDPEIYYKESREVKSKGLTIVTTQDVTNAEKIVEELKTNEFISPIINLITSDNYEVFNQLQIEGYEIDELPLKSMIDRVIISHKDKTITPYDLKCVWSIEGFFQDYYLYRLSYIQAYLYREACYKLKQDLGLEYYKVENLKFIVVDSINYFHPLVYTLDSDDMDDAYNGFEYRGKKYPGVKEIIKDLIWAKETGKWNISRKNYENGGFCNIKG